MAQQDLPDPAIYTALLKGSLRLSATGEWWHNGQPFTNPKVSELFHRSITWSDEEQQFFVYIGQGRATFDLDDTAYFVLTINDSQVPWSLRTNRFTEEPFDPSTLALGADDQVYCTLQNGHLARFSRAAHQRLIEYVVDDFAVEIGGKRYTLSKLQR